MDRRDRVLVVGILAMIVVGMATSFELGRLFGRGQEQRAAIASGVASYEAVPETRGTRFLYLIPSRD